MPKSSKVARVRQSTPTYSRSPAFTGYNFPSQSRLPQFHVAQCPVFCSPDHPESRLIRFLGEKLSTFTTPSYLVDRTVRI